MNWIVLALVSSIAGFLTALPIGTTHIEVAKRVINGHTISVHMIILGAIASDFMYGLIAIFGIAPLFKDRLVEALFWFISAMIVLILGIFTIIYGNDHNSNYNVRLFKSNASFIVGLTINIANPSMIVWWLFVLEFFESLGVISKATFQVKMLLVLAALSGMILSYILFAKFTEKFGSLNFANKYKDKIDKVLGILLILISIFLIHRSLKFGFVPGF